MPKNSAGLLMYRFRNNAIEVFLVHPGGPFWARKDLAAWSVPKGEIEPGEDPLVAARREFEEETGLSPSGNFVALSAVKQPGGKVVQAWAFEGDYDPKELRSAMFTMEWPPRSGKQEEFPEVDRGAWFGIDTAKEKIHKGQVEILEELRRVLSQGINAW